MQLLNSLKAVLDRTTRRISNEIGPLGQFYPVAAVPAVGSTQ
jgi:hypothetical protein